MSENGTWPKALPRARNRKLTRIESLSPWFEIYRVNRNTFALLEPRHCEEVISYLIAGTKRAVLFDTGMGIADIGVEVRRLTALPVIAINSHSHYDHIGGNHCFKEVWAFDHQRGIARIERGYCRTECQEYLLPGSYLDLPADFDPASYRIRPARITRRLRHLETIELGERELVVHHTPGETPESISLLDRRAGLLFTGDTFYPGTLWAHCEESDFGDYRRSLEYLVGMLDQVSRLCPAHNEASVPKDILTRVLEGFRQIAENQIEAEVQNGARIYRFQDFSVKLKVL